MKKSTMAFKEILDSFDSMFKDRKKHPLDDPEQTKKLFQTYVEPCHPFVFLPEKKEEPTILEMDAADECLDLPFPCIHIEVLDSFISVPDADEYAIDGMSEFTPSYCMSFIVRETGPKEYRFLMNMCSRSGQPIMIEVGKDQHRDKMMDLWRFANSLLKIYLNRLNKEKVGVESQKGIRHLGEGKNKKFYKLKPITYVSPKKYIHEVRPLGGSREVDWSHRWEVRGHWRTVRGIGKDRDGNYTVAGFTWVVNHERGPESKPLIHKTYVVREA